MMTDCESITKDLYSMSSTAQLSTESYHVFQPDGTTLFPGLGSANQEVFLSQYWMTYINQLFTVNVATCPKPQHVYFSNAGYYELT